MNDEGYITISRKLFNHYVWNDGEQFSRGQAWIDLLALARFSTQPGRKIVNGKVIEIKRGQMVASIRFLKDRWNWNSNRKVKSYLDLLESDGMLERQTEQGISIITISNYATYNKVNSEGGTPSGTGAERERNTSGTLAERERNKDNKDNKGNKANNGKLFYATDTPPPAPEKPKQARNQIPPTLADTIAYFKSKSIGAHEANQFHNYHSSRGWIVGKSKMKDWQAAARTWIGNIGKFNPHGGNDFNIKHGGI